MVGIYQYSITLSKKSANQRVIAGNSSWVPNSSKIPWIAGIATNVPTTNITNNNTNCMILGTKIAFIFLRKASVSSKYFTACSNEFVNEPDNSPTFIIFI